MATPLGSRDQKKGSNSHCCVPLCNSDARYDPGLHFHHIPKDEQLKKQWIQNIRRDEGPLFRISSTTVVCSKHFTKEDYPGWTPIKKRLGKGAVPSLFDWSEEKNPRRLLNRKMLSPRINNTESFKMDAEKEVQDSGEEGPSTEEPVSRDEETAGLKRPVPDDEEEDTKMPAEKRTKLEESETTAKKGDSQSLDEIEKDAEEPSVADDSETSVKMNLEDTKTDTKDSEDEVKDEGQDGDDNDVGKDGDTKNVVDKDDDNEIVEKMEIDTVNDVKEEKDEESNKSDGDSEDVGNEVKDENSGKEKVESGLESKVSDAGKTDSNDVEMNGKDRRKTDNNDVETNGKDIEESNNVSLDLEVNKKMNGHAKSETGSINSEDSEKENMNTDLMPMDLSTKSSTPAQDIIMLSDESDMDDVLNKQNEEKYSLKEFKIKHKMIKRLQAELRNEEAKLVLLKKLRLSQMSQQLQENAVAGRTSQSQRHGQSQPPPLVRGTSQQPQVQHAKPAHNQLPQLARGGGGSSNMNAQNSNKSQGPPPLVMAPNSRVDQRQLLQNQMKLLQQQQQQQQQQQRSGSANSTVQNNAALAGFRGTSAQAEALRQMQAQQRVVEETPAQRQAAAKLALRKQLEKTLLQIPPPKPPPPEMNFIPSLGSPDFIYLLGLEEAVNFIIDTNLISKGRKQADEKMVCNPFTCVQCGSDFTPVWKREKPGSKNVICEQCVTTNQKKALKQEHTNRLKSAFVKALQQEQEIERMQSQETTTKPAPPPPVMPVAKEKPDLRESRDPGVQSARNAAQSYKESMAETLRQHQSMLQAHQAAALRLGQPLGLQGFNPRAPFPYQLPFAARASDLQRQYLMDMIPKGGLPWNS